MANIKVDFAGLEALGNQIKTIAGELDSIINEASGQVTAILGGWDGAGASAFSSDYENYRKTLADCGTTVTQLGDGVVKIADAWQQADSSVANRG